MKVTYLKIRADFKYCDKGRFFRTFLVKEDAPLQEFGEFMVDIFGGTLEHYFLFRNKEMSFIPPSWLEMWNSLGSHKQVSFLNKKISDLGELFEFEYDTGDGWVFKCRVYKKKETKDIDEDDEIPYGFVLDGKGMGIWEDSISSLYAYLDCEIDKDYNQEDEERGIYKPWNFDIDKYSEFDNPLDLEDLNDTAMYFFPTMEDERL